MAAIKTHYQNDGARDIMVAALSGFLDNIETEPIFIFIGSDRHLLDCFGPLTGTMLHALAPDLPVYGTLDDPIHAQNLLHALKAAKQLHADKIIVAIDASVGDEEEIGMIQLRQGGLVPGKALAKNLPTVGQFAITGVVDVRFSQQGTRRNKHPGLALVYNMAKLLSESIGEWHSRRHPG